MPVRPLSARLALSLVRLTPVTSNARRRVPPGGSGMEYSARPELCSRLGKDRDTPPHTRESLVVSPRSAPYLRCIRESSLVLTIFSSCSPLTYPSGKRKHISLYLLTVRWSPSLFPPRPNYLCSTPSPGTRFWTNKLSKLVSRLPSRTCYPRRRVWKAEPRCRQRACRGGDPRGLANPRTC